MVMKTCPTCNGVGHVEIPGPSTNKGGNHKLVQVDIRKVLDTFTELKSYRATGKVMGITGDTVKAIVTGTWAGFRRKTS